LLYYTSTCHDLGAYFTYRVNEQLSSGGLQSTDVYSSLQFHGKLVVVLR